MGEQVTKAANLGSRIHAACEVYAQSAALPENDEVRVLFDPVREWFDADVERIDKVETVVAHHEFGYAGTVDLVAKLRSTGEWAVVDFKTQRIKRDNKGAIKPGFYETWPLQLRDWGSAAVPRNKSVPPSGSTPFTGSSARLKRSASCSSRTDSSSFTGLARG
jgi:hypothetical protein